VLAAVTGAGIPLDEVVVAVEVVVPPLAGTAVCCATGDALKLVERSGVNGAFVLVFATGVLAVSAPWPGSLSRRRLIPRVEDSFRPIFVALIRI
jgi:hypothetical protein